MIKFLFVIIIVCAAVTFGPILADNQGFVHIAIADYILEMSLTTAVISLVVALFVLYLLLSLISHFLRLPGGTMRWLRKRSSKKVLNSLESAVIAYEEGENERTLALLKQTGTFENLPIRSLFIGAKAAFNLGKYDLTRKYLSAAEQISSDAQVAANIVRARCNLRIDNPKAALEYLDSIKESFRNKLIYKLYYECYKRTYDIDKIYESSAMLSKYRLITEQDALNIAHQYFTHQLKNAKNYEDMQKIYKELPRKLKREPDLIVSYIDKLLMLGETSRAKELAVDILKKDESPAFLEAISKWNKGIPEVLELLKKKESDNIISAQVNVPLLKAIGNMELQMGLLNDAMENYSKVLDMTKTSDIYYKIAQILTQQQNYAEATTYFTKAALASDK